MVFFTARAGKYRTAKGALRFSLSGICILLLVFLSSSGGPGQTNSSA